MFPSSLAKAISVLKIQVIAMETPAADNSSCHAGSTGARSVPGVAAPLSCGSLPVASAGDRRAGDALGIWQQPWLHGEVTWGQSTLDLCEFSSLQLRAMEPPMVLERRKKQRNIYVAGMELRSSCLESLACACNLPLTCF